MVKKIPITTLFLDIWGVLLSNGWGHESRKAAAETFNLDYPALSIFESPMPIFFGLRWILPKYHPNM